MPDSFAESAEGVVLIANGVDPVLRWDGLENAAVPAGVAKPSTALLLSGSGAGGITGSYRAYTRFVDKYGNYSDLSPVSDAASVNAAGTVTYTAVPTPTDSKVTRRQVLRNTAGQFATFYVDIDTTDVSSSALTSTRTDADLKTQESQALLDAEGADIANVHGTPPDHKPYVAFHLNRMWMAGTATYAEGSVSVTKTSTTVLGHGTEWTAQMAGRYLHVSGATRAYLISSVGVYAEPQTLTLDEAYTDATDPFAAYAIRPAPGEEPLLYFSQPSEPESWPAVNALSLPEDGDAVTGLMPKGSWLFVLKRRRIYRVTAQGDPLKDGFIFLTAGRGCVNDRCWVVADDVAYLLDEGGVHAFDGSDQARGVSEPIQPVFQPDGPGPHVNWRAARYFHASHDPGRRTIRWFVALRGDYLPRHALCFAYKTEKWWVEEYAVPVGASALGRLGRPSGGWHDSNEQVFLGGPAGRVFALGQSALDGPDVSDGTLRGTVTAAGVCSLTDSAASFSSALVGVPVAVASGRGLGQTRVVVGVDGTTLRLDRPWATKPDSTSTYQAGGIRYRYLTARLRYAPSEDREGASAELLFSPLPAGELWLRLRHDFAAALKAGYTSRAVAQRSTKGNPERRIDLTTAQGAAFCRFDRHREASTGGPRFVRLELEGVSGAAPVQVGEMLLTGVV